MAQAHIQIHGQEQVGHGVHGKVHIFRHGHIHYQFRLRNIQAILIQQHIHARTNPQRRKRHQTSHQTGKGLEALSLHHGNESERSFHIQPFVIYSGNFSMKLAGVQIGMKSFAYF